MEISIGLSNTGSFCQVNDLANVLIRSCRPRDPDQGSVGTRQHPNTVTLLRYERGGVTCLCGQTPKLTLPMLLGHLQVLQGRQTQHKE